MALDFPNSPATGDTYSGRWVWDGQKWTIPGMPLTSLPLDDAILDDLGTDSTHAATDDLGNLALDDIP